MTAQPRVPILGWSWPTGAGPVRAELKLPQFASLPSPGELEALRLALHAVLGLGVAEGALSRGGAWRMAGRWWRPTPWQGSGFWGVASPKAKG